MCNSFFGCNDRNFNHEFIQLFVNKFDCHRQITINDVQFSAVLSGDEEIPCIDTQAVGIADFAQSENSVEYTINATGIEDATAGHIHYGIEGENGQVIVTLFIFDTSHDQVPESGTISADNLTGPLEGIQVKSQGLI